MEREKKQENEGITGNVLDTGNHNVREWQYVIKSYVNKQYIFKNSKV